MTQVPIYTIVVSVGLLFICLLLQLTLVYLLLNSDRCFIALCWQKQLKNRDYADSESSWLDTSWDSGPGWPLLNA